MIRLAALVFASLNLSVALAAGGGGGHGEDAKREAGVPSLDLPPFMAPVTENGELKFYLYLVVKLDLTSDFKKPVVLEKVPYLQDALLRHVHSVPIAPLNGTEKVDESALSTRLKPVVEGILGPDVVAAVGFRNVAKAAH
jgi:hypothetical protein